MFYLGRDGVRLSYEEMGTGRAVVLMHGRSDRGAEFVESGLAERLTMRGRRVILPDMRGHGASAKPHDPALWPLDVHVDDALALIDHLALSDYDIVGHSLGGRNLARMLVRGATPRRAVISGMGLQALRDTDVRSDWYREFYAACGTVVFEPGSDEQETEKFLCRTGADPKALLLSLDSYVDTLGADLARVAVPTLVLTGAEDWHDDSAAALARALGAGQYIQLPGDHFSAKASAEFAHALIDFLER